MTRRLALCATMLLVLGCRSHQVGGVDEKGAGPSSGAPARTSVSEEEMARLASPSTPAADKYDIAIRLGWATPADKADYFRQKAVFDERLSDLRKTALGKWAVVVRETVFVSDNYPEALQFMDRERCGRQFYVAEIE